jgi:CheY-like chemotaxis protein
MGTRKRRLAGIHDDSREVLEHAGALVTAASSARQAIEFCASLRPDVIVTDLAMPDDDGVWLAEQLRARGEACRSLP